MLDQHPSVLTLAGPDAKGIVHGVSGLLHQAGGNGIDSKQFGDLDVNDASNLSPMRVHSPDRKCAVLR